MNLNLDDILRIFIFTGICIFWWSMGYLAAVRQFQRKVIAYRKEIRDDAKKERV